jgi:O-acetyl-ADP-ribose deacetylase (regulator of RNase III)
MIRWAMAVIRRWRMKTLKPFRRAASAPSLRVSLADRNAEVARALAAAFADADAVEVAEGDLLDLEHDAVVSPANSFGDMGGGIDKAIDDFHRGAAQRAVMAAIAEHFLGELPVGMALVVELPARRFPFVVAAPTMRVPGGMAGSLNAYLTMRAALVAVLRHNTRGGRPIRSVAIPGLGTGVGGMPAAAAAGQMRAAYDSVVGGRWRDVISPVMAPYAMRRSETC